VAAPRRVGENPAPVHHAEPGEVLRRHAEPGEVLRLLQQVAPPAR